MIYAYSSGKSPPRAVFHDVVSLKSPEFSSVWTLDNGRTSTIVGVLQCSPKQARRSHPPLVRQQYDDRGVRAQRYSYNAPLTVSRAVFLQGEILKFEHVIMLLWEAFACCVDEGLRIRTSHAPPSHQKELVRVGLSLPPGFFSATTVDSGMAQ